MGEGRVVVVSAVVGVVRGFGLPLAPESAARRAAPMGVWPEGLATFRSGGVLLAAANVAVVRACLTRRPRTST